jgi:GntR family transcriptional regulator
MTRKGAALRKSVPTMADNGGIDARLKAPLYHQIFLVLRDGILDGRYRYGDVLPSEHELAGRYGVSRITAKHAMTELANAGLVTRARGRGTTVQYRAPAAPLRAPVGSWLQTMEAMGRSTEVAVLDFAYGPATMTESEALELPESGEVQRSLRVRSIGKQPISMLITVLPADVGHGFDAKDLAQHPMLELIRRNGTVIGQARQVITATLADQRAASCLATDIGAPLLKLQRVVRDKEDRPIEFLTAFYRPDRYQMEMVLSPDQTVQSIDVGVSGRHHSHG